MVSGYGAMRHFASGTRIPALGHMSYSGKVPIHTGGDPGLIERVRAERARRALYAGCDRAPFGWERRV